MARKASWIQAISKGRRWREADARRALDAWERSGLSMSAFMRQHGMAADRLRWWRKQLVTREAKATGSEDGSQDVALAPLVPVMVTALGNRAATVAVMFDDVRVEIAEPEAVGPTWVAELVHALRRRG